MKISKPLYSCLVDCDGYSCFSTGKPCKNYAALPDIDERGKCCYYEIIDHDLEKIKQGDDSLTFSELEKLLVKK